MRTISIKGVEFTYDSVKNLNNLDVQAVLAGCYKNPDSRPKCMCVPNGVPLQIKKLGGVFHLARMPAQGLMHAPDCDSHGETEHSDSKSKTHKIALSFSTKIKDEMVEGDVSLAGLINTFWVRAKLNHWSKKYPLRSWKFVANKIYKSVKGVRLNGTPISQLLWILPNMDEALANNVRESCLNFVRSCNSNGHYALIIAPIGSSTYEHGSMCLRFRTIDKPPIYVPYSKFSINSANLKEPGDFPYPVALILAKASPDKPYLHAHDIAMLWMSKSYTPCSVKGRTRTLSEIMETTDYLQVPLDITSGEISKVIAKIKKKDNLETIMSDEVIRQLPWKPHEKK